VGTTVVFYGTGFLAGLPIGVVWGSLSGSACPSGVTNYVGNFTCAGFTVPAGPAGPVAITANQTSGSLFLQATTVFTVTTTLGVSLSESVATTDVGISVLFTATASGGQSPYTSYAFVFGDGGSSSGSATTASHTYTTAGTYTVTVTVTDSYGSKRSGSAVITINAPPIASTPTANHPSADIGQTVIFTTTPSEGTAPYTSYTWTGLPSSGCSGIATATVTCVIAAAGSFSISVTVTDTPGVTSSPSGSLSFTTYTDPVYATPSASRVSADVGQSVTFTTAASGGTGGGYTYSWTNLPTGCSGTTSTVTCIVGAAQTVSISVSGADSNGFAASSGTLSFTVYSDPTVASPTPSKTSVDVGQTLTFSTSASGGSGGYTFGWSGLPTGCSGSSATISCTPTGSGSFTVTATATDTNGFLATSSSLAYTVFADPTVSTPSASKTSADIGQAVTISAAATLGTGTYTTYTWSNLPTGCAGSTASVSCTPTASGTFSVTVTVTDSNGYTSASSPSLSFTVYSDPAVTTPTASKTSVDVGQTVTFTASASSGSGSYTYAWTGLPAGCSGSTASFSCTPSASGSFTIKVTVTDSNGFAQTSGALAYTVYADPAVTAPTASPASVDVGQTASLSVTASSGSGGYTYSWSGLPTGCSGALASISCTPTGSGTFSITATVTDSNGYSVTSSSTAYTVYVDPTVGAPTASPSSIDLGQSVSYSVVGAGGSGGLTYSWSGLPAGCSGTAATVTCTPTVVGTFTITGTVTDSNSYSVTSSPLSYTIHAAPTVTTPTASTPSVDVGQSVTFSVTAGLGSGGFTYAWSGLPTGCGGASPSISCSPSAAGSFSVSVKVTDSNGASTTSSALPFTVDADLSASGPTASVTSADIGQTVTFSVTTTGGSGSTTYAWSGLPTGTGCAGSTPTLTCSPTEAGTFSVSVVVTDSNGYRVIPGTISFTVFHGPAVSAPSASAPSVDAGQTVTFSVSASLGSGGYTYAWTGLPAGCSAVSAQTSCAPTTAGSSSVTVAVTDSNGVTVTSTALSFTVYTDPQVTLSASRAAFDQGQSVVLNATATGGSGSDVYVWTGVPDGCTASGVSFSCTPNAAGTYSVSVKVTDSNGFPVTSNALLLVVNPPLSPNFSLTPASPTSGDNVTFTASVTGGTAPLTYTWLFGDGGKATGATVSHTYTGSGSYSVTLYVNDSSGGSQTKTLTVKVAAAAALIAGIPATEFWLLLAILLVALVAAGLVLLLRRKPPQKTPEEFKEPPKAPSKPPAKEPELADQVKELEDMSKTG
jgi:PKD repeat protein